MFLSISTNIVQIDFRHVTHENPFSQGQGDLRFDLDAFLGEDQVKPCVNIDADQCLVWLMPQSSKTV